MIDWKAAAETIFFTVEKEEILLLAVAAKTFFMEKVVTIAYTAIMAMTF